MSKHVAIVGAGVMGLLAAREFLSLGWHVTLYERLTEEAFSQSTSFAAGGMLAPYSELETAEPLILELGLLSLQLWPEILQSIPARVFYKRNGSLIISHQRDKPHFDQLSARILSFAKPEEAITLRAQDCEPELDSSFEQGLFLPNEAHLDNRQLLPLLLHDLIAGHARILFGEEVQDIQPYVVTTAKGSMIFDLVVDCRGIGSIESLPDLRGVKGEAFLVHAPSVALSRPIRLMHPRYAVYIVPRANNHYYIGATSLESSAHNGTTVRSSLELLSAAYSVHKGFGEAILLENLQGIRPAFPDNTPRIFFEAGRIRMNGLYRHGFLLAPVLARSLKLFLQDRPVPCGDRIFSFV